MSWSHFLLRKGLSGPHTLPCPVELGIFIAGSLGGDHTEQRKGVSDPRPSIAPLIPGVRVVGGDIPGEKATN